jgi:hypothetical protein
VLTEFQNQKIRGKIIDYFVLMHLLTEIANAPDGVCV